MKSYFLTVSVSAIHIFGQRKTSDLQDYLKAMDSLTIDKKPDIQLLKKEIEEETNQSMKLEMQRYAIDMKREIDDKVVQALKELGPKKMAEFYN